MGAIEEVLSATDALDLFGTIEKRAKIRYRRLVREVHPDANGNSDESNEAMKRLNKLWREYQTRTGAVTPAPGRVRPTEIARNITYVVLDEGDKWTVVERAASAHPNDAYDLDCARVMDMIDGTPVCLLKCDRTKVISQSDGLHLAYETVPHKTITSGNRIMFLNSVRAHLAFGRMHPEDFAWITKRVLFLSCVLAECRMTIGGDDKTECLAIAPDAHMLVVVTRLDSTTDPWGERDGLISQYLERVTPMTHDTEEVGSIVKFMNGVIGDRWASAKELMTEYDDAMCRLFGGIHFHEMKVI